jgi:hypothetical protein
LDGSGGLVSVDPGSKDEKFLDSGVEKSKRRRRRGGQDHLAWPPRRVSPEGKRTGEGET